MKKDHSKDMLLKTALVSRITHIEHVNWKTRAILGLLAINVTEPRDIANYLFTTRDEVQTLLTAIQDSPNRLINRLYAEGLPVHGPAQILRTLRCDGCGGEINILPCIKCCAMAGAEGAKERNGRLEPCESTHFAPGTRSKMKVLRKRVEEGRALHHINDSRL